MPPVSSPGIGSGLDVSNITTQLVALERRPKDIELNREESVLSAKLSAIGSLKGSIAEFNDSMDDLKDISNFSARRATSGDSEIFKVSASSIAQPGDYTIQVNQLAQAHKVRSASYTNSTDTVGSGKLTFQYGTYSGGAFTLNSDKAAESVTISTNNNTLQGIRDAINNAEIDVTATIINDGSGNYLIFTSNDSGEAHSLKVSVDDDDLTDLDNAGLSELAYDPEGSAGSGKNMTETVAAQNSTVILDGITISKSSNQLTDVVAGLTIDLLDDVDTGKDKTLTVTLDKSKVTGNINSFISSYNSMVGIFNELSSYDSETGAAGLLLGDSTLRNIQSQISRTLTATVDGLVGDYRSLVDLGIKTTANGTLSLTDSTLSDALDADFEAVGRIFSEAGVPTDSLVEYDDSTDKTLVGSYGVNITTIATQANVVGSAAISTLTIDDTNNKVGVKINDTNTTITIPSATYASDAALIAEVQSQLNGATDFSDLGYTVTLSESSGTVTIKTGDYGSEVTLDIVSGNGITNLFGGSPTNTAGVDVEGTIGGATATGKGQFLTGTGDPSGLKLKVTGGSTGARGSVRYTLGIADRLTTILDSFLTSDGMLETRIDSINNQLSGITDERGQLDLRMARFEEGLLKKFANLDTVISKISSTSQFLSVSLANLPKPKGGSDS